MEIYLPAYIGSAKSRFKSRQTSFLSFVPEAAIELADLITHRVGFSGFPKHPKARYINPSIIAPDDFGSSERADIVITDDPQEIFGCLDRSFVQLKFKLPDLINHARDILGLELTSWNEIFELEFNQRMRLFTQPVMMLCQKERRSEEALLGFKRYSWEQFDKEYTWFEGMDTGIFAFPKISRTVFAFSRNRGTKPDGSADIYITLGKHKNTDVEYAWIQNWRGANEFWKGKTEAMGQLILAEDIETIEKQLQILTSGSQLFFSTSPPLLDFYEAPSLLKNIKYNNYIKEASFALPDLQDLARKIHMRGFTQKTKTELSIMLGEKIAESKAKNVTPSLIFTNTGGNRPTDIEEMGYDHPLVQAAKENTSEDYYLFATRVISSSGYAPKTEGNGAGRVPVDGNFPSYYGVEPLDIFKDQLG